MRTTRSLTAIGLALALPFGLAACGGDDKPSKSEVLAGVDTMMQKQFETLGVTIEDFESVGVTQEDLDSFYSCIVDEVYDNVSNETLNKIVDGDPETELTGDDLTTIETASTTCGEDLGL
ncbi:hypothetical protein [Flaviflexus equikiangi]|uniref:Lipoprotein n=1 Tax=Flaviflexus equikiangi TaxID=2758573 RepID=A0ABS2TGI7_9ACTO|nr:hypothetical protein [Flaviflexus equikiangi]MBM9433462.1 hypothetical protein [Flaviflexus equikiangi]